MGVQCDQQRACANQDAHEEHDRTGGRTALQAVVPQKVRRGPWQEGRGEEGQEGGSQGRRGEGREEEPPCPCQAEVPRVEAEVGPGCRGAVLGGPPSRLYLLAPWPERP